MFVIEVPYFNLDQIYNSGLAPRWIRLKESKYIIPHYDKALKIEQQKERLIMSCTDQDFYDIWFEYLDLRMDYLDENIKIKKIGGKFKVVANRGNGIHILNQNQFEVYVFAKLIQNVGLIKARELMNRIAASYGIEHKQSMREAGKVTWFEWPSPERLYDMLSKENPGSKVKRFLFKLTDAIVNDDFIYAHNGNELFKLLGKHDMSIFPVNEIEDTLIKNFKCDVDEFADEYLDGVENKGLAYAYILHHKMNPPKQMKEMTSYGLGR